MKETEKRSFEERLARLEAIVGEVESGSLPLKETVARFEEGKRLLSSLREELAAAEKALAEEGPSIEREGESVSN